MRKKNLATCCGGLGACVCTLSMVLPVIAGTAGAAVSVTGSMSGMSGEVQSTGYWALVNAINSVGRPLLIASIALILYGMKNFGRWPVAVASIGGLLLYASMYMLNMSIFLIAVSAAILAIAYVIAYGPFVTRSGKPRRHIGKWQHTKESLTH